MEFPGATSPLYVLVVIGTSVAFVLLVVNMMRLYFSMYINESRIWIVSCFTLVLGSNTKVISCNDLNILLVPIVVPYLEHTLCDIF